jgi:5-methylcytosine-specific restriction endonuclease McrA
MVGDEKKEKYYVQKLYVGLRNRYKEGKSISGGQRVLPTSRKGKEVLEKCKMKCAICPLKYPDQPQGFEIHHVDGNRANPLMSNLVLLCGTCHNIVTSKANILLEEYKQKHQKPPEPPKPKKPTPKPCVTVNDPFLGRIKVLKADTEVKTNPFTGQKFRAIKDEVRIRGPRRC